MLTKLAYIADHLDKAGYHEIAADSDRLLKQSQMFESLRTLFDPGFSGLDRDSSYWRRLQRGWRRGKMDRGLGLILAINAERTKLNRKIEELAVPIKVFQQQVEAFYTKLMSGSSDVNAGSLKSELRDLQSGLKDTLRTVSGKELRNALKLRERLSEQQLKALEKIKGLDDESKTYLGAVLRGEQPGGAQSQVAPGQQPPSQAKRDPVVRFNMNKWLKTLGIKPRGMREDRKAQNFNFFRKFIETHHVNPVSVIEYFNANPAGMEKGFDSFGEAFGDLLGHAENAIKRDAEAAAAETKVLTQVPGVEAPVEKPIQQTYAPAETTEQSIMEDDKRRIEKEEKERAIKMTLERERAKSRRQEMVPRMEQVQELMGFPVKKKAPEAEQQKPKGPITRPMKPITEAARLIRDIERFGRIQQARKIAGLMDDGDITDDDYLPKGQAKEVEQLARLQEHKDKENEELGIEEDLDTMAPTLSPFISCDGCGSVVDRDKAHCDGDRRYCDGCAPSGVLADEQFGDGAQEALGLEPVLLEETDSADVMSEQHERKRERFNEERHPDVEEVEYYKGRPQEGGEDEYRQDRRDIRNLGRDPELTTEDDDYEADRDEPKRKLSKEEELENLVLLLGKIDRQIQRVESGEDRSPNPDYYFSDEDKLRRLRKGKELLLMRKKQLSDLPEGW